MSDKDTLAVVKHHYDALIARDVEAIMSDYAEDVVMLTNLADGPVLGSAAVRETVEGAMSILTPEVVKQCKIDKMVAYGDKAIVVFAWGTVIPFGTDTYIVQNGKIVYESAVVQLNMG